jgi:hypothetical protein
MSKLTRTLACAVVLTAALAPGAAAQAAPPSLGGVQFTESDPEITSCGAGEGGGSFDYEAEGTATGAYAGTYTEAGKVTVGPEEPPTLRQRVVTVAIGFTIDSPAGTVIGTKQYTQVGDPNINTAGGRCSDVFGVLGGSVFIANDDLRYSATITTPDGQTCSQQGPVSLSLVDDSPVLSDSFSSTFLNDASAPLACSGGEEPPPAAPASKEDCMDGGWSRFGFKNQGECIAFVMRGEKG